MKKFPKGKTHFETKDNPKTFLRISSFEPDKANSGSIALLQYIG